MDQDIALITEETFDFGFSSFSDSPEDCAEEDDGQAIPGPIHFTERCVAKRIDLNIQGGDKSCNSRDTLLRWSPLSTEKLEEVVKEANCLAAQLEKCAMQEKENSHLLINGSSFSNQPTPEGNPLVKVRLLQEERRSPKVPRSPRRETFFVMNSPLKDLLPTIDLESISPLASPLCSLPLESPLPPSIGESPFHTSLISRTVGCPQPSGKKVQKKSTPKQTPTSSPVKKPPCNPKLSSLSSEKAQAQNERNSLIHPILQPVLSQVRQKIAAQKNQLFTMNSSFIPESSQAQEKVGVHKDKHSPIHCNSNVKSSATREKTESGTKTDLLIHSSPKLESSPARVNAEAQSTNSSPVLSHRNVEFSPVREKVETKKTRRLIVFSTSKIDSSSTREKANAHKKNRSPINTSPNLECLFTMQEFETPKTMHSNHKLKYSPTQAKTESPRMRQSLILFSSKKESPTVHKKIEAQKRKQLPICSSPKVESLSVREMVFSDQSWQSHSLLGPKVESSPAKKNTEAVKTRHSLIYPSPSIEFSLANEEVNAHMTKYAPIHDNPKAESLQSDEVDTLTNAVCPIHASPKLGCMAEQEEAEAQSSMHSSIHISLNLESSQLEEDAPKNKPSIYTSTTLKYSSQVGEADMNKYIDIYQSPQLESLPPHMSEAHKNGYSPIYVSNNLKSVIIEVNAEDQSNRPSSKMNTTLGSSAFHEDKTHRNSICVPTETLVHNSKLSPIHRSPKGDSTSSQEAKRHNHMDFQIHTSPKLGSEQGINDDQKKRDSLLHTIQNCQLSLGWQEPKAHNSSHSPVHSHPTLVSSPSQEIHMSSNSPLHQSVKPGPSPSQEIDTRKSSFKLGPSQNLQTTHVQNNIDSPIEPILNVLPSPAEEATEARESRYSAINLSSTLGSSPSQEMFMNWHSSLPQSPKLGSSIELNIADTQMISSSPVNGVLSELSSLQVEEGKELKTEHSLIQASPRVGYSPSHQVHMSRHSPEPQGPNGESLLTQEVQPHTCRDSPIYNVMHVASSLAQQKAEVEMKKYSPSNICPNTRSLPLQEAEAPKNRQSPIHVIPSLDCSPPEIGTPKKHSPQHTNPKLESPSTLEKADVKKIRTSPIESSPKLGPSPKPKQAKCYNDRHFPTHTSPKLKSSPELVKIVVQNNRHSPSQQKLNLKSSGVCTNQEVQNKRHSPIHTSPILAIPLTQKNAEAENIRNSPIHAIPTLDSSLSTENNDNRHLSIYPSPKQKPSPVQEKLIVQKNTRSPIQQRLTIDSSPTKEKSMTPKNRHLPMYFKPTQNSSIAKEKVVAKKNTASMIHQRLKLESSTAQEKANAEKNRQPPIYISPKLESSQATKVAHSPVYTSPKLKPALAHDKAETQKMRHSPVHVHPKLVTVPTQEKVQTQKTGHLPPRSGAKVESTFAWKKAEPRKKTLAEIGLMRPKAFSSAVNSQPPASTSTTEKQGRNTGIPLPTSRLPVSSIPKSIGLKARSITPGLVGTQPNLDKPDGARIGLPRPTSAPASKGPHGSSLIPSRIPTATTTSRLQPPKKVIIPGTQR